jgi:hypothetical protein
VIRTAFEVVGEVLPQSEHSRARHALELLLGVEVLGVVEAVLLVLYQVVVGAPIAGSHHKRPSREFQRLYAQFRDFLTESFPRMRSYYLRRRFGAFEKLRKVDEFGGRSVRVRFRRALPLRGRRRVLLGDLVYLVLATFAQGGELAIRSNYVGPLFWSH